MYYEQVPYVSSAFDDSAELQPYGTGLSFSASQTGMDSQEILTTLLESQDPMLPILNSQSSQPDTRMHLKLDLTAQPMENITTPMCTVDTPDLFNSFTTPKFNLVDFIVSEVGFFSYDIFLYLFTIISCHRIWRTFNIFKLLKSHGSGMVLSQL